MALGQTGEERGAAERNLSTADAMPLIIILMMVQMMSTSRCFPLFRCRPPAHEG